MFRTRTTKSLSTVSARVKAAQRGRFALRRNLLERLEERITPTTYTWQPTAAGNYLWTTSSNWSPAGVPSSPGDVAIINPTLAGAQNIAISSSETIGSLSLGDAGNKYAIDIVPSGSTSLTMFTLSGSASITDTSSQGDVITEPLVLSSPTTVTNSSAFFLAGQISGSSSLSMQGAGTLALGYAANTYSGTTISSGTLTAPNTGSLGSGPVTQAGGTLNLLGETPITSSPIGLSGYNRDVIWAVGTIGATGVQPPSNVYAFDGTSNASGYCFWQKGVSGSPSGSGLPATGTFTSIASGDSGVTFSLQPYIGNNVMWIYGASQPAVTMPLTTPGQLSSINLLTSGGSGAAGYSFKLNFSDGSSQTVTGQTAPDWFTGGSRVAVDVNDRWALGSTTTSGFNNNAPAPYLYETDYTLPTADDVKTLVSITFTKTDGNGGDALGVFGLSGTGDILEPGNTPTWTNTENISAGTSTDNLPVNSNNSTVSMGPLALSGTGANLTVTTPAISPAVTSVSGFGTNGTGWTLNGGATVSNNVATVTTNANSEARTLWYNTPVSTSGNWSASFGYTYVNGNGADGLTFALQSASSGSLTGIGAGGGSLGYGGLTANSFALGINLYQSTGVQVLSGGNVPGTSTANATFPSVSPVNLLTQGATVTFNLSYVLSTDTLTMSLIQGSNTYSRTFLVNIPGLVGTSAYIGFTGGTGGLNAGQTIQAFSYTATPYSVNYASTSIAGTDSLNFTNTGSTPAYLGPLNDNGTPATLSLTGPDTVNLTSAATSIVTGTTINVNAGTLNVTNASALSGPGNAAVTVSSGATYSGLGSLASMTDAGTFTPGIGGAGTLNIGSLTIGSSTSSASLTENVTGLTAGAGFPQIVVGAGGSVNLGVGSSYPTLNLNITATGLTQGSSIDLIVNNTGSAVNGHFANLLQGSTITSNGLTFVVSYTGGTTSHDVVLIYVPPLYTDPDWVGMTGTVTVPGTSTTATIGANAFGSLNAAIGAALPGETIDVYPGTNANSYGLGVYPEDVSITKTIFLIIQTQTGATTTSFNSLGDTVSTTLITLNNNLSVGSDGSNTILSSPIAGTGSFTKTGVGSMTVSGTETNTGGDIVNQGNLILGASSILSHAVTVNSGGVLQMAAANTMSTAVALTVSSGGDFQLDGYAETVGTLAGAGTVEDANGTAATLTVGGTGSGTFTGLIQNGTGGGAFSLLKSGTGTLTLGSANTFTGGTTVSGGILLTTAASALGSNSGTDGSVSVSPGATLGFASSGSVTFGGAISGAGILAVQGGGTLVLSADTVSIGSVFVGDNVGGTASAGTLSIGTGDTLTDAGLMTLGGVTGAAGTVKQTGGSVSILGLQLTSASGQTATYNLTSSTLTVGASGIATGGGTVAFAMTGATLQASANFYSTVGVSLTGSNTFDSGAFTIDYSAPISGTGSLTKISAGTVILGGNTYSGGTTISQGVVSASLTGLGSGTVTEAGGNLTIPTLPSSTSVLVPIVTYGFNQSFIWAAPAKSPAVGVGTTSGVTPDYTYFTSNVVSTPGVGLPITGATNTNPIVITWANGNGLTSSAPITGEQVTIANAQGNTNANGIWTITELSYSGSGGTFSLNNSIGTTGGTYVSGTGTYVAGGLPATGTINSHYTTATGGLFSSVTFQLAPLAYPTLNDLMLAQPSHVGGLPTTGTLTLAAPGQYENLSLLAVTRGGTSTINYTLNFSDGSSVAAGTGVSVGDWFNQSNYAIEGLNRVNTGGAFDTNNGSNVNPRMLQIDYAIPSADWSKNLVSVSFTLTNPTAVDDLDIFGIAGSPTPPTTFNNVVTTSGTTSSITVDEPPGALGSTATLGTLTFSGTSTLNVNGTGSPTNAAYGLKFGAVSLNGTDTLTVANNGTATGTLSLGALSDGGTGSTLALGGPGTISLTAAGSLTAANTVSLSSGTLLENNTSALGAAAVSISPGATLTGNGSMGTLSNNGILDPGSSTSPGSFSTTSLALGATSAYDVTLNNTTAGTGYTQVATGAATIATGAVLNVSAASNLPQGSTFTLISDTSLTGTFLGMPNGHVFIVNNQGFVIEYTGGASHHNVVLIVASTLYVDGDWTSSNGYTPGESITPANLVTGTGTGILGTSAFSTIGAAIAASSPGSTIIVNSGVISGGLYPEDDVISTQITLILQGNNNSATAPIQIGSLFDTTSSATIVLNTPVTLGDSSSGTLHSPLSGTGTLTLVGTGSLTLTASETYPGPTTVDGGVLILGAASVLPASTVLAVNLPGDLRLAGTNLSVVSLAGTGTIEDVSGSNSLLTVTGTGAYVFSGVLQDGTGSGKLSLAQTGLLATLTLGGASPNTYSGGTALSGGGTLFAVAQGALGVSGVSATTGSTIAFNSGTSITYGGSITGNGVLEVEGNSTLTLTADSASVKNVFVGGSTGSGILDLGTGDTLTAAGTITLGGTTSTTGTLNESGGALSALSMVLGSAGSGAFNETGGSSSFGGVTITVGSVTLTNGTLTLGAGGMSSGSGGSLTLAGGTLQASANTTVSATTSLTGPVIIDSQANTLTYAGTISGGGSLTKISTGVLTLVSSANSYTNGTTINTGTVIAPNPDALGTGTVTQAGGSLTVASGGATGLIPLTVTGFNADTIWGAGGDFPTSDVDGAGYYFYEAGLAGAPTYNGVPTGLPASGTINSAYTTTAGAAGALFPTVTFQLAPYNNTPGIDNDDDLRLTTGQSGSLTVPTAQYSNISILATSGSGASNMNFTLNFVDGSSVTVSGVTVSDWFGGANYAIEGINRVTAGGFDAAYPTNPRLYEFDYVLPAGSPALSSIGFLENSGGVLNVLAISGTPLTRTYPNAVVIPANDTTGMVTGIPASTGSVAMGTLSLGAGSTLNVSSSGVTANASYVVGYGATSLTGTDNINVATNGTTAGTLTLASITDNGTAATLNLAGGQINIAGAGSLIAGSKINVTASGILNSENGTALGSAAVSIAAGATLAGSGTAGVVTDSGNVDPGTAGGPGSFSVSSLAFNGVGSSYTVVLNGTSPGTGYTQVTSAGTINLAGATLNASAAPGLPAGATFVILSSSNPIVGTFNGHGEGSVVTIGTQAFTISYKNDEVTLSPLTFYVDSDWSTGYTIGASVPNPNPDSPGNPASAIFGTNAFATIDAALAKVTVAGQTILVTAGTVTPNYPENVSITQKITLIFQVNTSTGASAININSLGDTINTATILVSSGVTLTIDGGPANPSTSISSVISGGGYLIKAGTGSLTLLNTESLNGGVEVSGGTLVFGAPNIFPSNTPILIDSGGNILNKVSGGLTTGISVTDNGLLTLDGNSAILNTLTGTGTVQDANSASAFIDVTNTCSFGGVLQNGTGAGKLSLTVGEAGTLTLTGTTPSTFSGGTTVNSGTLEVTGSNQLGLNTAGTTDGSVSLAATTTLYFAGGDINYDGAVSGTGTANVASGTLTLTSGTSFAPSTLLVGTGAATGVALDQTGGAVSVATLTIGVGASSPDGYTLSGGSLTVNGTPTVSGSLDVTGGTATVTGLSVTGSLGLSGTGVIQVGSGGISGGGTATFGGGTLQATANTTDSMATTLTLSSTTTINTQAYNVSMSNEIAGTGGLTKTGTGTLTLGSIYNSYFGGTTINLGTVVAPNQDSLGYGQVTQAGGTLDIFATAGTYPNNVSVPTGDTGTTVVNATPTSTSTGMGTLSLGGGSTFNVTPTPLPPVATSINGFAANGTGWTLNGGSNSMTATTLTTTTDNGGEATSAWYDEQVLLTSPITVNFTYTDVTTGGADGTCLVLQDSSLTALGGGGGELGYAGMGQPNVALALNVYNGHNIGYALVADAPGQDIANFTTAYAPDGTEIDFSSGVPVNVTLSYDGSSTLTITFVQGAETFTTSASGYNLATLLGGSSAYIGFTGATGGAEAEQQVSNFSFATSGAAAGTPVSLTFGQTNLTGTDTIDAANLAAPNSFAVTLGPINDSGTTATLDLTGAATVIANSAAVSLISSSTINVNNGILQAANANALGSAAVTVGSAGTLEGYSSLGSLTVNGTVSPTVASGSTGMFDTAGVTFSSSGIYSITVDGATSGDYSEIDSSSGVVNLGNGVATLEPPVLGYAPSLGDSYTIIQSTSPIQGTFAGLTEGSLIEASYNGTTYPFGISYQNDEVTLTYAVQTAVEVGSSNNPSPYGTAVTFTADIFAANNGTVSGTVTFYDNGTAIGTEPVSTNAATISTSTLSPGLHNITATFIPTPDSGYLGSTGTLSPEQQVTSTTGPSVSSVVVNPNQGASGTNTYLGNSRVLSIQVNFSEPVDISSLADAFKLTNIGTPNGGASNGDVIQSTPTSNTAVGIITVTPSGTSGTTSSATLTFSNYSSTQGSTVEGGSLTDGLWSLSVSGVTSGGTPMSSPYTTPAGSPILRLFGDYTGAGVVSSADLGPLGTAYGLLSTSPAFIPAFDVDGNGEIDSTDLGRFGQNFGLTV